MIVIFHLWVIDCIMLTNLGSLKIDIWLVHLHIWQSFRQVNIFARYIFHASILKGFYCYKYLNFLEKNGPGWTDCWSYCFYPISGSKCLVETFTHPKVVKSFIPPPPAAASVTIDYHPASGGWGCGGVAGSIDLKGQYRYVRQSRLPFHASMTVYQTPSCIILQFWRPQFYFKWLKCLFFNSKFGNFLAQISAL